MSDNGRITLDLPRLVRRASLVAGLGLCGLCPAATAQVSDVVGQLKLSQSSGNFGGTLANGDGFGTAIAALGDIDGDGLTDLAVGSGQAGNGGPGELWTVRLAGNSLVVGQQRIGSGSGGFTGTLVNGDLFGAALAGLGDLDGDGVPDLVVGAAGDNDGASDAGAFWGLRLNSSGTVKLHFKASSAGGFGGQLHIFDRFGAATAALGDVDGDGYGDIAVSAPDDDDGANNAGAVWIVFMEPNRVKGQRKISLLEGGFSGPLHAADHFGTALAGLGDLDGDGHPDLAVGASGDDTGGADTGAVWVLRLNGDGSVKGQQKLAAGVGGMSSALDGADRFGAALAATSPAEAGPTGSAAVAQIAVGVPGDDDGGLNRGALWLLTLASDGTATALAKVSATQGGFSGVLHDGDAFGSALADPGKNTSDDLPRLAVGAPGDDDGGSGRGAAWMLTFAGAAQPPLFTDFTNALEGRPGQPTLVLPQQGSVGDDFIGEPVVVVPGSSSSGNSGRVIMKATSSGSGTPTVTFGPSQEFGTGANPGQAANADFTGDGEPDVVTSNTGGDSISLLTQVSAVLGPNSFAPHVDTTLPFDDSPVRLAPGDFNGDDALDVAVAGSAGVTVFLNNGSGGFAASDFRPVTLLTDLVVGDVDEDGLLDVVAASGGIALGAGLEQGFATVLLGDGAGHLAAGGTFASGRALASVLLADFDGDLHLDALVDVHEFDAGPGGVPQATIRLFLGDGNGAFAQGSFGGYAAPNPDGVHPTYGAVADLDNDGRLDAVFTSSDNIAFAPGSFGAEQPPLVLTLLRNDGTGGFVASVLGTAYVGKGVAPLLQDIAPLPHDGNVDCILVWSQDTLAGQTEGGDESGMISLVGALVGDGQGSFIDPAPNQFLAGDEPGNPDVGEVSAPVAADAPVVPAGGPDLIVPSVKANALSVLLGDGAGGVTGLVSVPGIDNLDPDTLPAGGIWQGGPRDVRTGQLDGDGLLDAVVYNEWDDLANLFSPVASLTLLRGDGTGHFTQTQYLPLPRAGELALGNVTGTAALDVLVTQRKGAGGPDHVRVYAGLGNGTVATTAVPLSLPAGKVLGGGLAVADVEPDGRSDVVTTVRDGGTGAGGLLVFHNAGVAFHAELVPLTGAWSDVRSVVVGELTGDSRPDVGIGRVDGHLVIVAGVASADLADVPHFAQLESSAAAGALGGGALALGPLDGDSHVDIVSSNAASPGQIDQAFVRQLRGAGAGQFSVQTLPGLSSVGEQGSLRPLLTDMDGDGASDLVIAHGAAGLISILPSALNTAEEYGSGKPGKGGFTPRLSALGYTTLGGALKLRVQGAVGGAPAMLLIGTGKLPSGFLAIENVSVYAPLQLGGTPGVAGAGNLLIQAHMPNQTRFIGVEFALQLVVLDPAAGNPGPAKLSLSNGVALTMLP